VTATADTGDAETKVYALGVDTPLGTKPAAASADRGRLSPPVRGIFFHETLGEKRRIAVRRADDAA
jgi:hypothetical protein